MSKIGLILFFTVLCFGCGSRPNHSVDEGSGPDPVLPEPDTSILPIVNIAPAKGWPADKSPQPAPGFVVNAFATGLDHPRWLYVLPNGDVLVAESNAPPRPEDGDGIKGWITAKVMKRAGAAVPSANRITLLRDSDDDGVADLQSAFLQDLNSPFGMQLVDDELYVANTDTLMRFPYKSGDTVIQSPGELVAELPAGPINHHWTKNVIAAPDGSYLLVTVGSNSNIAENGMNNEKSRAAILKIDPGSGETTVFASGLRNPNGLAWQPSSDELWTTVNERDGLGSDLVPDYMTSVQEHGFYGWPYSYFGQHVDERVTPARPDLVEQAIVPDYALGPHTASLGLAFYDHDRFRGGAFVGQHGSWNRAELSGYKVIFVPFDTRGRPSGQPEDVLTGFVNDAGEALGRPVGVAITNEGDLLVADDVGNVIWRVTTRSPANQNIAGGFNDR